MKAIRKNGTTYEVKFVNDFDLFLLSYDLREGTKRNWYGQKASIKIDGDWYPCSTEDFGTYDDSVPAVKLSRKAQNAIGVNSTKTCYIALDGNPEKEWQSFFDSVMDDIRQKANTARFSYIEIYNGYILRGDSSIDSQYLSFNDKAIKMLNAFNALTFDNQLLFTDDFEGHDTVYRINVSDADKLFNLAAPELRKIEEMRKQKEIKDKKMKEMKENIANGAIYFHCESAPHDVDLSETFLTRPCPNSGSFTLEHRLSEDKFNLIKKYGTYYDSEFLDDCDMFFSSPGWRFGKDALNVLLREGYRVFVDFCELTK